MCRHRADLSVKDRRDLRRAWPAGAATSSALLSDSCCSHDVLDSIHDTTDTVDLDQSGFRDRDGVATSIGPVALAADETSRDEVVDGGDDVAGVDAGRATQVCLARWTVFLERREDAEVIATHARAGEGVSEQCLGASVGSPDEPGGPSVDPSQRGHGTSLQNR